MTDQDRWITEEMGAAMTSEEREPIDHLNCEMRRLEAPKRRVNTETMEMIDPSGKFSDADMAHIERVGREAKERYRRR